MQWRCWRGTIILARAGAAAEGGTIGPAGVSAWVSGLHTALLVAPALLAVAFVVVAVLIPPRQASAT